MSANCRRCGRRIVWAVTTNGKRIPLDPAVNPSGNVARETEGDPPRVRVLRRDEECSLPRYDPHFASCPVRPRRKRP